MVVEQIKKREDPRVRRTRKLLNQAFFDLMNEKGFQATTVQDIADRAEVNRATFYAHYEDKYDLLDSHARAGFLEWMAKNNPPSVEFNIVQFTHLVQTVFEFIAAMNDQCHAKDHQIEPMLQTAVQEELNNYLLTCFQHTPANILFLSQPMETVAQVWSWAIFGAAIQWIRGSMRQPAEETAAQVVGTLVAPFTAGGK